MKMLRVDCDHEFKGMDLLKHGESAYPADAWVEAQYMKEDAFTAVSHNIYEKRVLLKYLQM